MRKNKNKGFTLVELTVVIAIMAVLLAVSVPSLLRYTEQSRMQRDESAMSEVCNAVFLALADADTFDEVFSYVVPNNYIAYTDSSGVFGQKIADEEFWAPDGSGMAVTITFNPDADATYHLAEGMVNDMSFGNGSVAAPQGTEEKQCQFQEMGIDKLLYNAVNQTVGDSISLKSATYRNSSYTIFITYDLIVDSYRPEIYGSFNGTNLSDTSPAALGTGTGDNTSENGTTTRPNESNSPNFNESDLLGGGTITIPKYYSFSVSSENRHKVGFTGAENEELIIPDKFFDEEDNKWYKVTAIGHAAFRDCSSLASVTMPEGVTSISGEAFNNCTSLTSVIIPNSTTEIGDAAFMNCRNLASIAIPEGVTSIGNSTFRDCRSITSITIPEGVTVLENFAFQYCEKLTSITLPETVTRIGQGAFSYCKKLPSIDIPSSITEIGAQAFNNCTGLKSIIIPEGITAIGGSFFNNCWSLTSITVPNSVIEIGNAAMYQCYSITDINYNGTQEQWNTITKGTRWDEVANKYTIHCTDGDIAK